jgi:hypothetical protein
MDELGRILAKLTPENRKVFGWLAVFALLAWKVNSHLAGVSAGSGSVMVTLFVSAGLLLVAAVGMCRYIASNEADGQSFGLRLDREIWYTWLIFVAVAIVMAFVYRPPLLDSDQLAIIAATAMTVIATELVLRAFLIDYLVRIVGRSNERVLIVIVLSVLVLTLVQKPFVMMTNGVSYGMLIGVGLFAGYVCFYGRTLIYVCFILAGRADILLPEQINDGSWIYLFGVPLLLYLMLAGAVARARRHRSLGETTVLSEGTAIGDGS